MRRVSLSLLLLLILLLLALPASASPINRLYVWDASHGIPKDSSVLPNQAIQWYKRGEHTYYLFLPAGVDASNLYVHFTGAASSFTVGDTQVENNTVTNVFVPGTTVTLKNGTNSYDVRVMQGANTDSVLLTTASGSIAYISESKSHHEKGALCVITKDGRKVYSNDFDYVRVRGNNSFYPYKKSFHIRLNDGYNMLGMGSSKTWLLIANYVDNSQIRNAITFDMAFACGLPYTAEYRFVDVFVNTVYYGTYLLAEKVQISDSRVDIQDLEELTQSANDTDIEKARLRGTHEYRRGTCSYYDIESNPEDITGGYLMHLELEDRYTQADTGFVTQHGQAVQLKSPEYISHAQIQYISSLVQSFENAIFAKDGVDPETGRHFFDIADKDSMVGKYLIEEISKNLDANKSSFYIFKDSDYNNDKLQFGPVWDFDNAYANFTSAYYKTKLTSPEGLYAATDDYEKYYWWPQLYTHEEFVEAVKEAYELTFRPCIEVLLGLRAPSKATGDLKSLDAYASEWRASIDMNFTRWRIFNADEFPVKTGRNYDENIEYLRTFLTKRMAYLDSIWLD
ncbi:MAG: CotH kinase family protein [Clostridia bacterium]|nr:CotH kinase family protein [Clostridia bacterium]